MVGSLPSSLPSQRSIPSTGLDGGLLSFIYAHDHPDNCFPSLHVSLTVLASLIWAARRPGLTIFLVAWVVLVAPSTLFTKQHVLLDVLAGAVLGGASFRLGPALADP